MANEANLQITKQVDKTTIFPEESINYTISIKNIGDVKANNANIVDNIPSGTALVIANTVVSPVMPFVDNSSINQLNIALGNILANNTVTVTYKVTTNLQTATPILNTANVIYNYTTITNTIVETTKTSDEISTTILETYIYGVVWYDLNCNGIRETYEPFAEGILVELFNSNDSVNTIAFASTDVGGEYKFSPVSGGNYFIKITPKSKYKFTLPNKGSDESIDSDVNNYGQSVNIEISNTNLTAKIDGGVCGSYKISGVAFYDCDKNSKFSNKSKLLSDVVINIYNSLGQQIETKLSDINGYYEFNNLCAGNYNVEFIVPPEMNLVTQNLTYYGSKPDSSTGIASFTIVDSSILNGYAGFKGTAAMDLKYCKPCNFNSSCCNC